MKFLTKRDELVMSMLKRVNQSAVQKRRLPTSRLLRGLTTTDRIARIVKELETKDFLEADWEGTFSYLQITPKGKELLTKLMELSKVENESD